MDTYKKGKRAELELKEYFESLGARVEKVKQIRFNKQDFFGLYDIIVWCRGGTKIWIQAKSYGQGCGHTYGTALREIAKDKIDYGSSTDTFMYCVKTSFAKAKDGSHAKPIWRFFEITEIKDDVVIYDEIKYIVDNGKFILDSKTIGKPLRKPPIAKQP